jgi:hypothetical protein
MSRLFVISLLVVCASSCGEPARFRGSVRDLVPKQVGNYRLAGEVKPIDIAPATKYDNNALRLREGVNARYASPDQKYLSLQVINYSSAQDAEEARRRMQENIEKLLTQARITGSSKTNKERRVTGQRMIVQDFSPGIHEIIWTDTSLLYTLAGDNLELLLQFEKDLP